MWSINWNTLVDLGTILMIYVLFQNKHAIRLRRVITRIGKKLFYSLFFTKLFENIDLKIALELNSRFKSKAEPPNPCP